MGGVGNPRESATEYRYKHIVVVHGIGDHAPDETALTFMNEFIRNLPNSGRYCVEVDNPIADVQPNTTAAGCIQRPQAFRPSYMLFKDFATDRPANGAAPA